MNTRRQLIIISLVFLLIGCRQTEPTFISFENMEFSLPAPVTTLKSVLGLKYGFYSGFNRGDASDPSIQTQLEGYPFFPGSDTDSEENYDDQIVVGVTFFKKEESMKNFVLQLEKKYDRKFIEITAKAKVVGINPTQTFAYKFIEAGDGLFITLKEVYRSHFEMRYVAISFYKGVSETDLDEYLEALH